MDKQHKPFDVGNGLVCASFGIDGSWLSVGVPQAEVGLVEVTGAPAFPPDQDGQVDLVRAHRVLLTDPSSALLSVTDSKTTPVPGGGPSWHVHGDGWRARAESWAEADQPTVVQAYELDADSAGSFELEFRGRLDRPAYAEITPGGPIPPLLPTTQVTAEGTGLHLSTSSGGGQADARLEISSTALQVGQWSIVDAGASLHMSWDQAVSGARLLVRLTMTGGGRGTDPLPTPRGPVAPPAAAGTDLESIESAAVRYTLGCTALEVADGECCIITDHRLLPLSWTRDAYYQAALLLAHTEDVPEAVGVVERHLTWLWRSSRDEQGVWRRSHLTSGAVKDTGYQVDQQLFPVLELTDFRQVTGRWPTSPARPWGDEVRRVWSDLPRDESGLVPGEENPADDPSDLPYLLSSQLLMAYVARRLVAFEDELGISDLQLREDADRTLETIRKTFTCEGPFGSQWAYEADGLGGHRLYHDANDIPTALAPWWGLCDATDPHWRATMQFAFSEHNPGFVAGDPGGLGSAHTPGVWPLGDAQEWAVAVADGDEARAAIICERIAAVASADGMLPETYQTGTGEWLARHWFAWPGSLVGLLNATFHGDRGPWAAAH